MSLSGHAVWCHKLSSVSLVLFVLSLAHVRVKLSVMHLGNEQINSHLQCSKEKSRNEKKYSAFSATSDVCHAMKGESN